MIQQRIGSRTHRETIHREMKDPRSRDGRGSLNSICLPEQRCLMNRDNPAALQAV
jgi:hypothetical protein